MERTLKTWGEKTLLKKNDLCEISLLELLPQKRCSWHCHNTKFNLFYVVDGMINIKTEDGIAKVRKGQNFTTRPGEKHEFQTEDLEATVIEIMYVQYDAEDINRENVGGPLVELVDEKLQRGEY